MAGAVAPAATGLPHFPGSAHKQDIRTRAGAEIDLLLHLPDRRLWAIEVKRTAAPRAGRGCEIAASDLGADECIVVHPGREPFPLFGTTTAIPVADPMERLAALG